MSATKRSGSPSPIVRIKTSIVILGVREDGTDCVINSTEVSYKDVEHLTGLSSDFLEEMVQPSSGPPSNRQRPSPRASLVPPVQTPPPAPAPAPAPVPSPATRIFRIGLTGGTHARTDDPGAQRPHGLRVIAGFVELDLVHGSYEGKTRYRSSHTEYQAELIPDVILETDTNVDWKHYASPSNLTSLGASQQSSATMKKIELLQLLQEDAERRPDMALIYHVQAIVKSYLTRGRHDPAIKYHVLLGFLQDCAPNGMSISNLGFKIIMDYGYPNSKTLKKFEEFRKSARP